MAKKKKQQLVVAKHINPKLGQLKKGFITKYRGTPILLGFKMCDDFGSEESGGSDSRQKFGRRSESRLHLSASCLHPCCFITPLTHHPSKWGIQIFVSDFLSGIDCQRRWSNQLI